MEVGAVVGLALLNEESENEEIEEDLLPFLALITNLTGIEPRSKIYGYVEDVVPEYDELSFRRMFRMNPATFERTCMYLRECPELQPTQTGGKDAVSVSKQLLITLWYVGGQDTIRRIADRFGVSESSVILCRNRVTAAILNNLKTKIISWPTHQEMQEEVFNEEMDSLV